MNKKLVSIVLSAATLVSTAALAADCDPQFYVGGELQAGSKKGAKQVDTKYGNGQKAIYRGIDKKGAFTKTPVSKSASGLGLFVGSRFNENVGLELGASRLGTQKCKIKDQASNTIMQGAGISIKNRNIYADAMGYMPVDCAVDLIGSVGVGRLSTTINGKEASNPTAAQKFSAKSTKVGVRVGVGAQYKFTDNIGARLMVRHQQGNKIVKNMTSANLGMFYQF